MPPRLQVPDLCTINFIIESCIYMALSGKNILARLLKSAKGFKRSSDFWFC